MTSDNEWKDEEQDDDEDFVADEYADEYDGGRPKMKIKGKSDLNTRARNAFGADGTMLRIAFFVGVAVLIVLGIVFGVSEYKSHSSASNQLRQRPLNNGYEDYDWIDLPSAVQESAKVLGYNKGSWDHDLKTEHFDKDWNELTGKQQSAAATMGWDEQTWCTDFDEYEEEMSEKREFYPEYDWDELPYKAQNAASQFGFTQKEWDNDTPVLGMDKEWDELSPDLQLAAKTLGYDEDTWCEGENEYMKEESQNFINDDWEELPQNVKDVSALIINY